ncbi:LysR family transcriptional regulator [Photobacterium sp. WH77]|uniref:LysR family transcriptional regulator n=1 Tax=Photobacterium arenosum TaxID=2774143 RepID=A0ABR9BHD4_9GAMM|nr:MULTISPECIES: LysR family transcriptional regulator [Photobacterium]MBD8511960.1 LysR family transcriptional regulator [Photobacterium arenosum]MCG2836233.1 LysR family transcriptional regulator [Photobacterium sp. WH77]MCG2843630.1 LysR family transcriptional regulator [Photobacterium sp. WH80]MDO6581057.1 LysR family transcriptional regulator [Photobacterium sp. 2_MG-2023]
MDFNETAVFVKVVESGSFSAAARLIGSPTSTISTRVARLEKRLGVTLLQRTTRKLQLTEAGEIYFKHAAKGLHHILDAESAVVESVAEPAGRLCITAPADLGDHILSEIISTMRQHCPKVTLELVLMNRYVDLIAEGIDVAIRTGSLADSTLVAKKVGTACWAPFASPAFLETIDPPENPQDLRHYSCLQFSALGKASWTLYNQSNSVTVPMPGTVVVNDVGLMHAMAIAGEGIALLPTYLYENTGHAGKLVRILPEWHAKADPIHIVYPRQQFMPPKLRYFIDLASELLEKRLGGISRSSMAEG